MKRFLLLLLVFLVGCTHASEEQEVIREFLSLQAELYEHQEEVASLMETMPITEDAAKDETSDDVLSQIRSTVDEDAFERFLGNRMTLDETLMSGAYDRSEIKDIQTKQLSTDGDQAVYLVSYQQELYQGEDLKETQDRKLGFTLVNRDGEWKIFDIKQINE